MVKQKNKGITLIALIITIIIMLILVGVTIKVAVDTGLLKIAKEAGRETTIEKVKEQIIADIASKVAEKLGENITGEELEAILTPKYGTLTNEEKILDKTLITKDGNSIPVRDIWNRPLAGEKAEVTPVYAYLCDTDKNGEGETLVLSSTQNLEGYTIIKNYGDNEAYQTDENNAEKIYENIYYYPIWKNETSLITNVIIHNKIAPTITERWFANASNLSKIENITNLDTSNVEFMSCMFMNCKKFVNLNLSSFDTSSVTDFRSMFYGCSGLTSLDLSSFDTSSANKFNGMFTDCSNLTSVNLSSFNTSAITQMSTMFLGCLKLTSLDLSSFDTSNVQSMSTMFSGCKKLQTIIVGPNWNTENVASWGGHDMFQDCTSLKGGEGTVFDANHIDYLYAHIDEGDKNPGYLTSK